MLALTAGGSLAFYTFTTYMQKYLVRQRRVDANREATRVIGAGAVLLYAAATVVRRRCRTGSAGGRLLITFGVLGTMLTVPAMTAHRQGKRPDDRLHPDAWRR